MDQNNFFSFNVKSRLNQILSCLFLFLSFQSGAHTMADVPNAPQKTVLRVGFINLPPYIYLVQGKPAGIAYDMWELIAKENNIESTYILLNSDTDDVVSKTNSGEIDVALSVAMDAEREKEGNFSLPYFRSHFVLLAKKVPINFVERLISVAKTIPVYFVMIFILAYILYIAVFFIFERKQQPELSRLDMTEAFEFTLWRSLLMGLRNPPFFPITRFVRTLSVIWTLLITTLLFSLFAGVTSTLIYAWAASGEELTSVNDLNNQAIDVQGSSITLEAAKNLGFTVDTLHDDIESAIKRLDENKVPALFMPNEFAIIYLKNHPRSDLYISKIVLPSYYVGFLLNDKHAFELRDVNYSILKMNETGEKMRICKKYLGIIGAELCY